MTQLDDIAVLVLAAGLSHRYGEGEKLLAPLAGKPLALHIAETLAAMPFHRKLAVCKEAGDELGRGLAGLGFQVLVNAEPEAGQDGVSPRELAAYLAGQYADAEWSRPDHYAWIAGLLPELGLHTLADLGAVLAGVDDEAIVTTMGYRYPPGAVRRLDDALLASFGERYVDLPGNAHRRALLQTRLERMSG